MSSDIETFLCMIQNTKYITDLLFGSKDIEKYKKEINIIFDNEKFSSVKEIVLLNNQHINKAIKELLSNQQQVEELIRSTNIKIEEIKEIEKIIK